MKDWFAGVIFWNDGPELLQKCLRALSANGIQPIAIDGAFHEFLKGVDKLGLDLKPHSTDGCIDVAKAEASFYVPCPPTGWQTQMDKRNTYLKMIPDGAYCWYIDADEILRPFTISRPLVADVYRIMTQPQNWSTMRVYKKYPDLAYCYQHSRLYRMDQHQPADLNSGLVFKGVDYERNMRLPLLCDDAAQQITIDHYAKDRPKIRNELKRHFYGNRCENAYPF